jgi:hypothetical protein
MPEQHWLSSVHKPLSEMHCVEHTPVDALHTKPGVQHTDVDVHEK